MTKLQWEKESYSASIAVVMRNVARAATYVERSREVNDEKYHPEKWQHRLEQLAYWLGEGIRLGVPYRTLGTASRLFHPERVKRFVRRYASR